MNLLFRLLMAFIVLANYTSCENDDPVETLNIYSTTLNGSPLTDGLTEVPLNGTIELAFSHVLNSEAFNTTFSFSGDAEEVDYSVILGNAGSKATISYSGLNPDTSYTIAISQMSLGSNGEGLTTDFTSTFTTTSDTGILKTPCRSANASCLQRLTISDDFSFEFYSSYDIISDPEYIWEDLEEMVVVMHGQSRNADDYFRYMTTTLGDLDKLANTLVISPFFRDEANASANELYWDTNWRSGGNSANTGAAISSFSILDQMITIVSNSEKFPNLKKITFTGHSSGSTLIQHYAFSNTAESEFTSIDFQYIIANNQYFFYPDGRRYNESTNEFYIPEDCTGYTFWPYGLETAPNYLDGISESDLLQQQITRKTIYLLGTDDINTDGTLNTTDCAATLLGSNRLERGRIIFDFFETFYPENNHEKIEVPNVGHDAEGMYSSDEFKNILLRE